MSVSEKELQRLKALPDSEFREWVIMQMKKCDERFKATVDAVAESAKLQSEAIDNLAQKSETRHAELVDKLSVFITISQAGKGGVKLAEESVKTGSRWAVLWLPILGLIGLIATMWNGHWPPK